jgi:hypothetical protein
LPLDELLAGRVATAAISRKGSLMPESRLAAASRAA